MSLVSAAPQSCSEMIKRFWVSDNRLNGGFGDGNEAQCLPTFELFCNTLNKKVSKQNKGTVCRRVFLLS